MLVENVEDSLRISIDVPIVMIESRGDHEFDLVRADVARVIINEGTVTLRRPTRGTEVTGAGRCRVLGGVSDSHFNFEGDLEVHGSIENTGIYISGDLEVLGSVKMGDHELHCSNALLRGGLAASAEVVCGHLEVNGRLESTGNLMAESLRCTGTLKAAQLEVTSDTTIAGVRHSKFHGVGTRARPRRQPLMRKTANSSESVRRTPRHTCQ